MLGKRIKESRKRKGFSQSELANLVDVKQASLSRIESGKVEPMRKTLIAIAAALEDDFGLDWVREAIESTGPSPPSKKDIAEQMSFREFASLKFGGVEQARPSTEMDMLLKLLDKEVERIKKEGF
mgnify:CR=1 FL=1